MPISIPLIGLDCAMSALADAIGKCVVDETSLEDRFNGRAERVVNDTVAKRRSRDDAPFRIADLEGHIAPRPIFAGTKLPLQCEKLPLQVGEK